MAASEKKNNQLTCSRVKIIVFILNIKEIAQSLENKKWNKNISSRIITLMVCDCPITKKEHKLTVECHINYADNKTEALIEFR